MKYVFGDKFLNEVKALEKVPINPSAESAIMSDANNTLIPSYAVLYQDSTKAKDSTELTNRIRSCISSAVTYKGKDRV